MSDGSSPASAIARSAASAPISRAVRPDAFVYAVSPIPTIATSPWTSSKGGRVSPIRRLDHGREANVRGMGTQLDGARAEAIAGNLNLLEFTREDVRWQRPHTILEEDGVLLFAGASDFPAVQQRRAPGRRHDAG